MDCGMARWRDETNAAFGSHIGQACPSCELIRLGWTKCPGRDWKVQMLSFRKGSLLNCDKLVRLKLLNAEAVDALEM
jgi:hypothetical protein